MLVKSSLFLLLCSPALCTPFRRLSYSFIDLLPYGPITRTYVFRFDCAPPGGAFAPCTARALDNFAMFFFCCFLLFFFFFFARFVLFARLFIIVCFLLSNYISFSLIFVSYNVLAQLLCCFCLTLVTVVVVVVFVISGVVDELIAAISCTRCTNFQLSCRS